jgi:type II secretory pathway component GspD/PulD (secretin)
LKKLREVRVIELRRLAASEISALLPAEYGSSSFVKVQPKTNSLYLSGSAEELDPIEAFINMAEERQAEFRQETYELKFIKADECVKLLPQHLAEAVQSFAGGRTLLARVNERLDGELRELLARIDKSGGGTAVRLKYINSEELLKSLPPSVSADELKTTFDPTLVFYTGTAEKKKLFDAELALLDRMKPQIRYQILVIQYQKSNNSTWDPSLSINPASAAEHIAGNFSNILNVNFDIISALGQNFAARLNWQLGEDRARVLADTTLNGLSGQEIKFENTNTFRYLDAALDPETGKPLYTGTTREINSGLSLTVNGWVSGDGMITMKVNAKVSKQDEASALSATNPPPTSERTVNTEVRTKSGTPIIIGGLMQIEKTESENKLPVLGHIPLLGYLFRKRVVSDVTTEMVIYLVPHVYSSAAGTEDSEQKCESYLKRYGGIL